MLRPTCARRRPTPSATPRPARPRLSPTPRIPRRPQRRRSGHEPRTASPANEQPQGDRERAEANSTVKIYSTSGCTGSPLATDTAAKFASPGIPIDVSDDTSTDLRATATDAVGNTSSCSSTPFTYVEDSTKPATPSIVQHEIAGSPSEQQPSQGDRDGCRELDGEDLLRARPARARRSVTDTAAQFASPGISIAVGNDATTTLTRPRRMPPATSRPAPTTSVTYVEDSTNPPRRRSSYLARLAR